jgi:hypothetical protein
MIWPASKVILDKPDGNRMKLDKIVNHALLLAKKGYYSAKYSISSPGTTEWLVRTEIKYGGIVTNVPRNKVSPKDPRTKAQLSPWWNGWGRQDVSSWLC